MIAPGRIIVAVALAGAGAGACGSPDAAPPIDAPPPPIDAPVEWATYTIPAGQHPAMIGGGAPDNPLRGVVSVPGRDYRFAFDASAAYVLTMPVQPEDQLDWNKLPGLSDCEQPDLSADGLMFGWRWRIDVEPRVLEVTAYANNTRVHLTTPVMLALTAEELAADLPLRYRLWIDGDRYRFTIAGDLAGRPIDVTAELPRVCTSAPDAAKWAAGFYFGGTSVAPQVITARVSERPFAP